MIDVNCFIENWEDHSHKLDLDHLDQIVRQKDVESFKKLSLEDKVYCLHTAHEKYKNGEVIIAFPGDELLASGPRVLLTKSQLNETFANWCK